MLFVSLVIKRLIFFMFLENLLNMVGSMMIPSLVKGVIGNLEIPYNSVFDEWILTYSLFLGLIH